MNPDIRLLADSAREKIRGGYTIPYAINAVLNKIALPAEEKEGLRREIAQELNRRSHLRKRVKKTADKEAARRAKLALESIIKWERNQEARRMAYERRDYLLPDP